MTSVTFENAALAETIKRADRVAPKKGEAFDKASGILFDVNPTMDWVQVQATNLDVYYSEWVARMDISGEPVRWRIPSAMLAAIITRLPIGSGKTVTFENIKGMLHITSGRFKAKIGLLDPAYYPTWEAFDPAMTNPVADFGSRIEQVSWAADKGEVGSVLTGIRFDGESLAATDKYRLALVPCNAGHITEQITVPLAVIGPIVKQMGDTNVGIVDGKLALMPNEYTQIVCIIYESAYPKIERVMRREYDNSVSFNKTALVEAIGRVTTADQKSRMPELRMFIGSEEVAVYMEDGQGRDAMGDVIEVPGQANHQRFEFFFTPNNLIDALNAAPSEKVTMHYDVEKRNSVIYIEGGSGYESWIVPRMGSTKRTDAET